MNIRELLVKLGFVPETATFTEQQPGYCYRFGNLDLQVSELTNLHMQREMLFTGVIADSRTVGVVEFALPLEVESYEQGVAMIARNLARRFNPSVPTPWLAQGLLWADHLPGRREMRLYEQRPYCTVEADWFKVAAKRLIACGKAAAPDAVFVTTFADGVLAYRLPDQLLAMPAKGADWPKAVTCRAAGLQHLSPRTPAAGVPVEAWKDHLQIGRLRLQVVEAPGQDLPVPEGS